MERRYRRAGRNMNTDREPVYDGAGDRLHNEDWNWIEEMRLLEAEGQLWADLDDDLLNDPDWHDRVWLPDDIQHDVAEIDVCEGDDSNAAVVPAQASGSGAGPGASAGPSTESDLNVVQEDSLSGESRKKSQDKSGDERENSATKTFRYWNMEDSVESDSYDSEDSMNNSIVFGNHGDTNGMEDYLDETSSATDSGSATGSDVSTTTYSGSATGSDVSSTTESGSATRSDAGSGAGSAAGSGAGSGALAGFEPGTGSGLSVVQEDRLSQGSRKRSQGKRDPDSGESSSKRFRWWDIFDTSNSEPYSSSGKEEDDDVYSLVVIGNYGDTDSIDVEYVNDETGQATGSGAGSAAGSGAASADGSGAGSADGSGAGSAAGSAAGSGANVWFELSIGGDCDVEQEDRLSGGSRKRSRDESDNEGEQSSNKRLPWSDILNPNYNKSSGTDNGDADDENQENYPGEHVDMEEKNPPAPRKSEETEEEKATKRSWMSSRKEHEDHTYQRKPKSSDCSYNNH